MVSFEKINNDYFVMFFKSASLSNISIVVRKPVFGVSDQVRHKQDCTATEDG